MRKKIAVGLAVLQAADLVATRVSPQYGDDHLDHLGVPPWLRPLLPAVKVAAVCGLIATADRQRQRSVVSAALVAYYAAAATFHVLSRDRPVDIAPALVCGCLAAAVM